MVRLGRYTVLRHLASGGMADVLLGKSEGIEGFERHVVLKRIRPERARDQHFIKMFLDEARVAASLHHQNIVQVHDIGEADGEYFFAMEYIHGEDLRAMLLASAKQRQHMPLQFVIAIIAAAAAGLHHAHERRGTDKRPLHIVHRDVSPSNILVGYDGSIKLLDFGIAKAGAGRDTLEGHLKGKIAYMSPEQVSNGAVDRRSDVYSLGVVLYELATTTRLFRGDNDAQVIDQILHGRVPLPRVRRPDLSNELSTIIMTALASDPDRRFQTADDLRAALDDYSERNGMGVQPAQIASYMRKLFGDRPEPWLDLSSKASEAVEELMPTSISASRPRVTLTGIELAHGSKPSSSGMVRISRLGSQAEPPAMTTDRVIKVHAQIDAVEPTKGWSDPTPVGPVRQRGKLVLLGAALAAVCAAIFLVVTLKSSDDDAPAPAAAATRVAPAPQPIVSPIAPEPKAAPVAPVVETQPATVKKAPAPPPRVVKKHVDKPTEPVATVAKIDPPPPSPPSDSKLVAMQMPAPAAPPPSPAPVTPTPAPPTPATPAPATDSPLSPTIVPPTVIPMLANDTVARVAALHGKELSKCEGGDTLHGEVTVKFNVDPSGRVQKPQIATRLNKPLLAACILRSIMRWQFPRQGPDGAQGSYTLSFQ